MPDSTVVTIVGERATRPITLRFDAAGIATVALDPGVYRWSAPMAGARGVLAVEQYSPEFHPGAVATITPDADGAFALLEQYARERWWLFLVAIAALASEWAWRQRRGLP